MNTDDYNGELLTFDIIKLNLYSIVALIPIIIIYIVPYQLIWNQEISTHAFMKIVEDNKLFGYTFPYSLSIFFIMILGIVMHELIHGITFSLFTKNGFKAIRFGVLWKKLTPYCHCKEPLPVKQYIIGGIMPAILLGFLPFIYALIFGNLFWLIFAIFFTIVAIGDFCIIFLLRKEDKNSMVLDHPSEVGFYIYREK